MPSKVGLFSHLTCSVYIPYLENFRDLKLAVKEHFFDNKQINYTLFGHDSLFTTVRSS